MFPLVRLEEQDGLVEGLRSENCYEPGGPPNGGGEGKITYWTPISTFPLGLEDIGWKTRRGKKPSDKFIVKRRK